MSAAEKDVESSENEYDEDDGVEFRVYCDVSQETLVCGGGWFHKIGAEYDLCRAEYEKLSPEEQAKFVEVQTPEDLGEVGCANLHRLRRAVHICHPPV